ncbi:splicing factor 3B subunit 2 isoform X2 [Bacillus rossius redtenbacheri]|uniref:splicing factor 3B subunit 2 isoform X2 n=1 Tax=Bacillus rossius redtenbacheri TaxID=93214 RepID=UPI002FDD776A
MENASEEPPLQQRIQQQQMMIEHQRQEELLRLQQTALVEKQREDQERQMMQRRQDEELYRLQQEALMEKQREEGAMRMNMSGPPHTSVPPPPPAMSMPGPPGQMLPPGVDVSAPPPTGMTAVPPLAAPPPQMRVPPPPAVAMPPPPGMEPMAMGPPPSMGPGPSGIEPEVDGEPKPPQVLMSPEMSEEMMDVKLPIALEQALAFKTQRARQVGVAPEDLDSLGDHKNIPEPPPAPVISRSGLDSIYDMDDDDDDEPVSSRGSGHQAEKEKKNRRKKKKKKRARHQQKLEEKNNEKLRKKTSETAENEPEVEIEYIQETLGIHELEPMYRQFARIFETFRISEPVKVEENAPKEPVKEPVREPLEFKKVPKLEDEYDDDLDEDEKKQEAGKTKLSKRKLKRLTRLSVAELKQLVGRPDVVEMHDVTARDPKLLVQLKAHRNTVPVPRHWCFKRKYLQGKRGIEKPPFDLPDFIKKTGIMEMRAALQEKEDQRTLKAKMRERARPKLGKIDIDYQKLHDAFFKWQTKPRMSIHGDLYYEGKEFETRLKEKKPGDLSDELRTALGMPTGLSAHKVPPPWLIAMQRYGPPPSYPNLKIAGLNAPIPEGCSFGYHAGGWGKPPVDETGRPLYGDVFGLTGQDQQMNSADEEVDRSIWGELESESEEESEEEEEDDDEEGGGKEDETGLVTPAEGLITPSGITSIPAGMETPEIIELRKRKIESEMEGGETPALYQVLPEKRLDRVGGAMMASTHIYDMAGGTGVPAGAAPPRRVGPEGGGTVELALDPSELDLVDTEAMAVRYEQQIREQQSQLQKEDLSDMLADHVARQKNKRKQRQQHQDNKQAKKYKEFKF